MPRSWRVHCALSPIFALSRTPLSEFQQPVKQASKLMRRLQYEHLCSNIPIFKTHNKRLNMTMTTITSRSFNQDVGRAKRATAAGPVVITDRGKPAHVLLSFQDYAKMTATQTSVADLLSMPSTENVVFEPPKLDRLYQPIAL